MSWHKNQHAFDRKQPTWFFPELTRRQTLETDQKIDEMSSMLQLGAFYLVKVHENSDFFIIHLQKPDSLPQKSNELNEKTIRDENLLSKSPSNDMSISQPAKSPSLPGFLISFVLRPYQIPRDKRKTHGEDELIESNNLFVPSALIIQWLRFASEDNTFNPRELKLKLLSYTTYCRYKSAVRKLARLVELKLKNISEFQKGAFDNTSKLLGIGSVRNTEDANNKTIVAFCRATVNSFRFLTQALNRHPVNFKSSSHDSLNFSNEQYTVAVRRRETQKKQDATWKDDKVTKPRSRTKPEKTSPTSKLQDQHDDLSDPAESLNYQQFIEFIETRWVTEDAFNSEHQKFMQKLGKSFAKVPVIGFVKANLYVMFLGVIRKGGFKKVCRDHQWKEIYFLLQPKSEITNATTCTRRHYEKLLYDFEKEMLSRYGMCDNEVQEGIQENLEDKISRTRRKSTSDFNLAEKSTVTSPWTKSAGTRKRRISDTQSNSAMNMSPEMFPYFSVEWILTYNPANNHKRAKISPMSSSMNHTHMYHESGPDFHTNVSPYYPAFDNQSMTNGEKYENQQSFVTSANEYIPTFYSTASPFQTLHLAHEHHRYNSMNCDSNCHHCYQSQMTHQEEPRPYYNSLHNMH